MLPQCRQLGLRLAVIASFLALTLIQVPVQAATTNSFRTLEPPLFHRVWQFEDGLPNPSVRAIAQDRDGYLLLATDEGLARFDGVRFQPVERKTKPGRLQRWYAGLITTHDGSVWYSSVEGGIVRYSNGEVTRFTTNNSALPDDFVLTIFEDSKTNLWVGSAKGISRFTGKDFVNYTNQPGLIVEATRAIAEDHNGNLWFGTAKGLSKFDGKEFRSYTTNDALVNNAIYCLFVDQRNGIWVGSAGGLTYLKDDKAEHFTVRNGLAHNIVRVIREDAEGRLFVGSQGGLQILKAGEFKDVRFQSVSDPDYKINSMVYSIFEDRERNLWVGTSFGLNQLRNQPIAVYSQDEGLPVEVISAICEGPDDSVWIATYGGGLCRIHDNKVVNFTTGDGLPSNHLLSLAFDAKGALWIGTDGQGVSHYAGKKFTNYRSDDPKGNVVRAIYCDSRNFVWLASNLGVSRVRNNKILRDVSIAQTTVKSIAEGPLKTLWFAGDDGLVQVKIPNIVNFRDKLGFSAVTANSVTSHDNGELFVGTDIGLFCLWERKFHLIESNHELEHRRIINVVEDDFDNIWLGTPTGILSIPKSELVAHLADRQKLFSVSSFGKQEGMRRAQCNGVGQPSAIKTKDGRIWVATMNGVAIVNANNFRRNTSSLTVKIEEISADGAPLPLDSSLQIPPGKGNLEIAFTALSLQAPEKVRFQYKLEGVDAAWIDGGNRRVVRYANLAPGDYRFTVRAANNDGIWNSNGTSVRLTLKKHFYETLWFAGLCVILATSLTTLVVMGRVQAVRNREVELKHEITQHTEKLQKSPKTMESFNYSIAHDLRAPLRAIKGLTMALHEDYSGAFDETAQEYSRRIREAVDRMDSLIADLLAFGSISHKEVVFTTINLDAVVQKVLETLATEIAAKTAWIEVQKDLGTVWANETLLQQVLQNLISNALKFVAPGVKPQLKIWTERADSKVKVLIRDNGIGIAPEHHERIFGVFERLHAAGAYPGTGIGLAIVTKAVERMEGSIGLHSKLNEGSCFWIELHQGKETTTSPTRKRLGDTTRFRLPRPPVQERK